MFGHLSDVGASFGGLSLVLPSTIVRWSLFGIFATVVVHVRSSISLCLSSSVVLVFSVWCLLSCLSVVFGFSGHRCLVCVCISFSVFYGPSLLTNFGSGSDSGSDSLRVASYGTIYYAFLAHPAGLRFTHCVFVHSLLVSFSFWSCWHWFPLRCCLSRHASRTTLSKTRTLTLIATSHKRCFHSCIPPSYHPFLHSHTYVVVSISRTHTFAAYSQTSSKHHHRHFHTRKLISTTRM